MDNVEYIDVYFKGSPTDEQKQAFEQRITDDVSFAEEVAFYISANGLLKEQLLEDKKRRFKEIYEQQKTVRVIALPFRKTIKYMAAASIAAAVILLTWLFTGTRTSPQRLADQYIQQNFQQLHVTMGKQDSLQMGLNLYNKGNLPEALSIFEGILKNNPANSTATKYAGITSLQLEKYEQALAYFSALAADNSLVSNYGKFYEAVCLLKRNQSGDIATAKKLLQEVIDNDRQEEKEEAREWLKKLQ
ncbi:MAG: hypothetical protein ABIQ31_01440 [Ferruginibacter sp.]